MAEFPLILPLLLLSVDTSDVLVHSVRLLRGQMLDVSRSLLASQRLVDLNAQADQSRDV